MKRSSILIEIVVILIFLVLWQSGTSSAQIIPSIEILSQKFATKVEDYRGVIRVEDPTKVKFLILTVKCSVPQDTLIMSADFNLGYDVKGRPGRSRCVGLSNPQTSLVGEATWLVGNYVSWVAKKGVTYFFMCFDHVEPTVKIFNLNFSQPIKQNINIEAPFFSNGKN